MAGVTNNFGQKGFNRQGMSNLEIWDTNLSAWIRGGRVLGTSYMPESDKITQEHAVKGRLKETQERTIRESGMLTVTLMEQMSPMFTQLVFGHPDLGQTKVTASGRTERNVRTLYSDEEQFVSNEYGIVADTNTPAPVISSAVVTSGALGLNWSTGSGNWLFVVPIWGTLPDTSAGTEYGDNIDTENGFAAGTPSAGEQVTIVVATDDVAINMAGFTGPHAPDFYVVFHNTTNTLVGATFIPKAGYSPAAYVAGSLSTTTITVFDPTGSAPYSAGQGVQFNIITNYGLSTQALTALVIDTDITWNPKTGSFKRIQAGTTALTGVEVLAIVWNLVPAEIKTPVGASSEQQNYKKLRLISIGSEVDPINTTMTQAEGEIFIFHRANLAGVTPEYSYSEDDFDDGAELSVKVLYDDGEGEIGEHFARSNKFENWVQQYE